MDVEVAIIRPPARLPASLKQLNPVVIDGLIRLGVEMDGGYVVPRWVVVEADALLSFGLGPDWSFERDAATLNPNLVIHVYDHSVGERKFIDDVASSWRTFLAGQGSSYAAIALFEIRVWMDLYESYRAFFCGRVHHFQERVFDRLENSNDATAEKILARLEGKQKLILKMDIEGGEYRVIDELLTHHERIRLMVIEFHATEFVRSLFLEKMAHIDQYYEVVHVHGNNCVGVAVDGLPDLLEITFLHKSLCESATRRCCLPITGLDFPNDPRKAEYELLFTDA